MITEAEYAECSRYVARKHIVASNGAVRNARRVSAEIIIIRNALDVLDSGKPRGLFIKVLRRSRKDCGFSLQTWLTVISLTLEVITWVLAWWKERQVKLETREFETAHQDVEHTPPHTEKFKSQQAEE